MEISEEFLGGSVSTGSFDAEKIVDLPDEDDEGNAGGKAADDGRRDEGDEATEAQETDEQQPVTELVAAG